MLHNEIKNGAKVVFRGEYPIHQSYGYIAAYDEKEIVVKYEDGSIGKVSIGNERLQLDT